MTDVLVLIALFERHEAELRAAPKPHRKPAHWRTIARELVKNGQTRAAVSRRMGIAHSTICEWTADLPAVPHPRAWLKPLPEEKRRLNVKLKNAGVRVGERRRELEVGA